MAELRGTTVCGPAKAGTLLAELEGTTVGHLAEPQVAESGKSCHSSGRVRRNYSLPFEGTKPQERLAEVVTRVAKVNETTVCRLAEPEVAKSCRNRHSGRVRNIDQSGRTTSGRVLQKLSLKWQS